MKMMPVDSPLSITVSNYSLSVENARHEKIKTFKTSSTVMP